MLKAMHIRGKAKARQEELDALAPRVGDIAPDFELCDVNGEKPVRLSDHRGQKPAALLSNR